MNASEFLALVDVSAAPPDGVYPTLDEWSAAIAALKARDNAWFARVEREIERRPAEQRPEVREAAVRLAPKLCKECAFKAKGTLFDECHAPQQRGFDDRVGADSWFSASTIRQTDCHGQWWTA